MERNRRRLWLSRLGRRELTEGGLGTGEYVSEWSEPVAFLANASAPSGTAQPSPWGTQASYDLTLVMDAGAADLAEGDRVWLANEEPDPSAPGGSYVVGRVSPSLSGIVSVGLSRNGGR